MITNLVRSLIPRCFAPLAVPGPEVFLVATRFTLGTSDFNHLLNYYIILIILLLFSLPNFAIRSVQLVDGDVQRFLVELLAHPLQVAIQVHVVLVRTILSTPGCFIRWHLSCCSHKIVPFQRLWRAPIVAEVSHSISRAKLLAAEIICLKKL